MRETLNQIRTKFLITKPRNYIRRIIKKCVICNRHEGNPFQYPATPDLPSYRLSDKFALTYSAVDYAGPLYVNNIYGKLQTLKGYKTITSQNVSSEVQIKNFLFRRKIMFCSQDIQVFVFLTIP